MSDIAHELGLFLHLVRASELRQRPMVRDRLLVLAGVIATDMGLWQIAAYCRHRVLEHNGQHLLRRWPTMEAAINSEEFQLFLTQLRRRYPLEKAERMLDSLGIDMGRERDAYYSDHEYAAALLGTTPDELDQLFGDAEER